VVFGVEGLAIATGKLVKELRLFEVFFELGFALGLKLAELFHVLADVAIDARFIKRQERDFFRLAHEGHGFGEGDVGLGCAGIALVDGPRLAENVETVFDRLDAVETPMLTGDAGLRPTLR